jgi:ligand-binding sensor domain-containing protein
VKWAALAVTCLAASAQAMDPDRAMSQYGRERWGTDRGFPGGTVYAISQTADGYLWLGTDRGLLRFDGSTFRRFPEPNVSSVSITRVMGLAADTRGSLWVRMGGAGVLRYRDGRFQTGLDIETMEDAVTAMTRTRDGSMVFAGIVNGPLRWNGERLESLAPRALLPARTPVTSIGEATDGTLWLGTQGEGLFHIVSGQVTPVAKGLPDRSITAVLPVGARDVGGDDRGSDGTGRRSPPKGSVRSSSTSWPRP